MLVGVLRAVAAVHARRCDALSRAILSGEKHRMGVATPAASALESTATAVLPLASDSDAWGANSRQIEVTSEGGTVLKVLFGFVVSVC